MISRLLAYLPRGNMLDEAEWKRRHVFLQWVLLVHVPGLFLIGLLLGRDLQLIAVCVLPTLGCLALGHLYTRRRPASVFVTAGLTYSAAALTALTDGTIQGQFHFFVIIGFIALYQDWVPFLFNVIFTMALFIVLGNGIGTLWQSELIFNHLAVGINPWLWSMIHGSAVVAACLSMVVFWRFTEEEQHRREALVTQLADAEIGRRRFTSDLLVNLARRNQSMLYRQLDIINQLEEKERDPDALAELFHLDHLATRVRRNAESLLVLSGEKPSRVWSAPVPLRDVVRAAIAETEDLDRVDFVIDEWAAVSGQTVTDLTHLLAELTENAVRFSSPQTRVTIRTRPYLPTPGAFLLTIEDLGVGMPPDEFAAANQLLADPPDVDLSVSQRLGFHVVTRLAQRHDIKVSLTLTPGGGLTAVVLLPASLFARSATAEPAEPATAPAAGGPTARAAQQSMATAPVSPMSAMPETIPAARTAVPSQAAAPMGEGRGTWTEEDDAWAGWWYAAAQGEGGYLDGNGGAHNGDGHNGGAHNGGIHNGHGRHFGYGEHSGPAGTSYDPRPASPMAGRSRHSPAHVQPAPLQPLQMAPAQVPAQGESAAAQAQLGSVRSARPSAAQPSAAQPSAAQPSAAQPSGPETSGGRPSPGPRLSRRVPQSHLAPELRATAGDVEPAAPAHTERASEALSRYQASRQAAKAAGGDAAGGGWQEGQRS